MTTRHLRKPTSRRHLEAGAVFETSGDVLDVARAMQTHLQRANRRLATFQAAEKDPDIRVDMGFCALSDMGASKGLYFDLIKQNGPWARYGWVRE